MGNYFSVNSISISNFIIKYRIQKCTLEKYECNNMLS